MNARYVAAGYAFAVIGSAVIVYWFIIRLATPATTLVESTAFDHHPTPFIIFAALNSVLLFLGPKIITSVILEPKPQSPFNLLCLSSAWMGVVVSHTIGDYGVGGVAIHFYWWGLALTWSFLTAGTWIAHKYRRPLVVRDWTILCWALSTLPVFYIPSFLGWQQLTIMDIDQAMITAVTIPFAGVFLIAHWFIFEVLDNTGRK